MSISIVISVSAVCSLFEATLLSLTPAQIAELYHRRPKVAKLWQRFKTEIHRPIAVILFLNTSAYTIGATIAGAQFRDLFQGKGLAVFSIVFTFMMLQFTEILPKTLGVRYNSRIAPVMAYPLAVFIQILSPFLYFLHLINRPFAPPRSKTESNPTMEEISALAGLARLSNIIGSHQEQIIKGAAGLSNIAVSQVMIPVHQITFISTNQTLTEAILTAHLDPHTRFPIHEGDSPDQILGYVNFKEMVYLLRTNPVNASLRGIIRPVRFASSSTSCSEILKSFVEEHVHMAVVRSGDGHVLGLVTMEDIVEELIGGELEDEFDRLPKMFHSLEGGTWMVGGGLPVSKLFASLGVEMKEVLSGTVSDWLVKRMGRVPKVNETFKEKNVEFMIRRIRRGRIFETAVTKT
ncbi:MAG: HlyC/CorC family transporter [Candidatus Aureabacteria bacterium]|nr:HlyC/CorC family transporter [Candidatus Auribacterota bacterium]